MNLRRLILASLLATFALTACGPAQQPTIAVPITPTSSPRSSTPTTFQAPSPADAGKASTVLARMVVKPLALARGYTRAQFGPAWADTDHNGCDQRNDVLRRDLTGVRLKTGSRCLVASGVLHDPYTGKTIKFVRGTTTSDAVQIDHVVALDDAWQTGAATWTTAKREQLATDERPELLRRRRSHQPGQRRRRRRLLASAEHRLSLPVRGRADRGQGHLRPMGDPIRARRDGAGVSHLPEPAVARLRPRWAGSGGVCRGEWLLVESHTRNRRSKQATTDP